MGEKLELYGLVVSFMVLILNTFGVVLILFSLRKHWPVVEQIGNENADGGERPKTLVWGTPMVELRRKGIVGRVIALRICSFVQVLALMGGGYFLLRPEKEAGQGVEVRQSSGGQ